MCKIILTPTTKGNDNDITDYRIIKSKREIGWIVEHPVITYTGFNKVGFIFLYFPLPKKEQLQLEKKLKELAFSTIYGINCAWSLDRS